MVVHMAVIPGLVVSTASSLGKATVSSFGKAAVSSLGKALQVVCSLLQDHVLVFFPRVCFTSITPGDLNSLWKCVVEKISGDCYWPKSSANAKFKSRICCDFNGKPAHLGYCLLLEHSLIDVPELCISQDTFCRRK